MNLTRICKLTASILLIFSGFHNGLAGGTHYLIGVGSPMSGAERQAVWTATLNFAMLQMKLGDQLSVYNASSMQPVGERPFRTIHFLRIRTHG
jgi:hypothetical protein